jgi:alpha-glucosidase
MAVLLLATRGTPQMYYGEELGMRTTDPTRIEDVHDPIGKLGWPKEKGRDGERTPMQWDGSTEAGFTTSNTPWLPVPPSANRYNVETERKDPDSIFNTYKQLLSLRKSEPALRDGSYEAVNETDPNVFAFLRRSGDSTVLVALNFSGKSQTVRLNLPGSTGKIKTLLKASGAADPETLGRIPLGPFGFYVGKVQ